MSHGESENPNMIALYYSYPPRGIATPSDHVTFHQDTCTQLNLAGRIRVSSEGINGVLSGSLGDLKEYELSLRRELAKETGDKDEVDALQQTYEYLDIKYCHLRSDIPLEQQLFDSLNVKVTKEVVSLFDFSAPALNDKGKKNGRRCRQRRKQIRKEKKMNDCEGNGGLNKYYPDKNMPRSAETGDEGTSKDSLECTSSNNSSESINVDIGSAFTIQDWEQYTPAEHLSPSEWNDKLLSLSQQSLKAQEGSQQTNDHDESPKIDKDTILLDARNIYETRVGHFAVPNLPTFFPNTRKFSSLPMALNTPEAAEALAGKKVFMYCTGGIRCERAGSYLRALSESNAGAWKDKQAPKEIYQLKGGIQRYLETFGDTFSDYDKAYGSEKETACLYRGKNFVFDPRRTDPVIGRGISKPLTKPNAVENQDGQSIIDDKRISLVGKCIVCSSPHDDYDNGHAPVENKEARCCRCRVLVLVCNDCRNQVRCWGESEGKDELFCGNLGKACVDEGNIAANVETEMF